MQGIMNYLSEYCVQLNMILSTYFSVWIYMGFYKTIENLMEWYTKA